MRLFEEAFFGRVPGVDAVVETGLHAGPEPAEPLRVAADAPLAIDLHDAAQLAVGRGVEVVHQRPDRQRAAEHLVAALVLRRPELRLAERPLQGGKQVRDGLRVVPDVRTRAGAAAGVVVAPFPGPQPAVGLAEHGGRLEDREIGRHGLDHFRRQRAVVEAVAEAPRLRRAARRTAAASGRSLPRCRRSGPHTRGDTGPGSIVSPGFGGGVLPSRRFVRPAYQARRSTTVADLPAAIVKGTKSVAPGEGPPSWTGGRSKQAPVGHVFPGHGQGIEPAAAEPGAIDAGGRRRSPSPTGPVLPRAADLLPPPPQRMKPPARGLHGLGVRPGHHVPMVGREIPGIEREDRLDRRRGRFVKRYSKPATGRLEQSASPGSKGLQAVSSTSSGTWLSESRTAAKGKRAVKTASRNRGRPERRPARPVAAARRPEQFPTGHGALQHAGDLLRALDGDSRERARLVENLRAVAERDVRQCAAAFQADHARADAAQRKGHAIEMRVAVLAVVGATGKRGSRRRASRRRPAARPRPGACDAAGPDRSHGGGRDFEEIATL